MSDYKQLNSQEAISKLQEIIKHQPICMMVTDLDAYPAQSRPMGVAKVDDTGVLWFLTLTTTKKYEQLKKDSRMALYFSQPSDQEFLSLHARTELLDDQAKKKELWSPLVGAWVPNGVENPDLRILKVTPEHGYYWDTTNGKVVALAKIAASLVTGRTNDDGGVEGKLKI